MSSIDKDTFERAIQEAAALDLQSQLIFLRGALDGDDVLVAQALSRVQSQSGNWWDTPGEAVELDGAGDPQSLIGQSVGPYRIVRALGSGGMGDVVLAERDDGHFRQQVALKLVKRGALSKRLQGRLKAERQILATLNHPNIARLLDGGVTRDGTPFIVMEYVDGLAIDTYCDQKKLSAPERLQLFRKVCSAVHAAHQNLIVHRDLKPSNILVTADGTPKLLDFGIAKILDERDVMHTLAETQVDMRVMTPDHASPEQIMGLPITTASDTYVLGVLLYELLTGRRPFALTSSRLGELERIICKEDPKPPSAMVTSTDTEFSGQQLEEIAAARSTSLSRLKRELRGDLDNIMLMAMRKEPERRYSSVEQFSSDIERHLTQLPVIAQPATWSYRASKLFARHTALVTLGSALFVAIVAFAIVVSIQATRVARERDRATAERAIAEQQRERAEQVSAFLTDIFAISDPDNSRGETVTAREILDSGARRLDTQLADQPAVRSALDETIGRVYLNLGLLPDAQKFLERSLDERKRIFGMQSSETASALASLAALREVQGDYATARSLLDEAIRVNQHINGRNTSAVGSNLYSLAVVTMEAGDVAAAEKLLRESLGILNRTVGASDPRTLRAQSRLGVVQQMDGKRAAARATFEDVLQRTTAAYGENHPLAAEALQNLSRLAQENGDLQTAQTLTQRALEICRRVLGPEHSDTITTMVALGSIMQQRGELNEAAAQFNAALELDRRILGPDHDHVANDLSYLGFVEITRGRPAEAEKYFREALAIFQKSMEPGSPFIATARANLGRALIDQRKAAEAEPILRAAVAEETKAFGADSRPVAIAQVSLARALALLGHNTEADALFRQSYPRLVATMGPQAAQVKSTEKWLTDFYTKSGRPQDATALIQSGKH